MHRVILLANHQDKSSMSYYSPKRHIHTVQRPLSWASRMVGLHCWFYPVAVKRRAVGVIYGNTCLDGNRVMVRFCVTGDQYREKQRL